MKRVNFLIVILIISLYSCNNSDMKQKNSIEKVSENEAKQLLYGDWVIKREITTGPVTAYGEKELKEILSTEITYASDFVKVSEEILKNPKYNISAISKNDFFNNTYVNIEDIGMNEDSIVSIDIDTENSSNFFGSKLYISNKNSLILFHDGGFFELERQ